MNLKILKPPRAASENHTGVFRSFMRVLTRLAPKPARGAAPFSAGAASEKS